MSTKTKIAFGCYLIAVVMLVRTGLVFLFASEILPHHYEVAGVEWGDLSSGVQTMFLVFMKGSGLGTLTIALAMGILLLVPFRRGDRWARWAIPAVGLAYVGPVLCMAVVLAVSTGAATPWPRVAVGVMLLIVGFLFSGDVGKAGLKE